MTSRSLDLRNLVECLDIIFAKLNVFRGKDLVLPIGFTGSGKSTLITSLVYGPESL